MCSVLRPIPVVVPTLNGYKYPMHERAGYPTELIIVKDKARDGFTKTVNRGLETALDMNPEFVVILNDDAYPCDVDWLKKMVDAMNLDGRIGFAGPSGLCSTFPQVHGVPHMEYSVIRVDQLAFFCVVIRSVTLNSIGLLDESYIHYASDNDIVWRARDAGWWSVWVPHVYIVHDHKASESEITREWKAHDKKVLKERWPSSPVHSSVRGIRRIERSSRIPSWVASRSIQ
jgi:GT2 family glycosyltransferase